MSEEKLSFQAEVSQLLDIVVNSLYSEKEIFLRELISNASDSCDKLRYSSLTDKSLSQDDDQNLSIRISLDIKKKLLTIHDNGIGMSRDDLINNLGTIAKSGTKDFMKSLTGNKSKDVSLIGQFGVGFYSAFMVAKKVEVFTRKAGETDCWYWVSDGKGTFKINQSNDLQRGAKLVLHLRSEAKEFLEVERIKNIVKTYSDHISIPVILETKDDDDKINNETLNTASALWTRPKNEITETQYSEFYKHISHGYDEPWHTLHFRAEGAIEYTGLMFIPTNKPFDLFQPERKSKINLYVNRVFIADDLDGLLPSYLRFIRGIIDSPDLPLNISREMLQDNPQLRKIKKGLTSKILKELKNKIKNKEDYNIFWNSFGAVLKEGLYEDIERREDLLELCKFQTINAKSRTLKEYIEGMNDSQNSIYYLTGESVDILKTSPQLEIFKNKNIEVILLTDPVDEFWISSVGKYKEHEFKSVMVSDNELDSIQNKNNSENTPSDSENDDKNDNILSLITIIKETLGSEVKDVKTSSRLVDSPVCLVGEEGGMSLHMERMMKQQGQSFTNPRILEINPKHSLIIKLSNQPKETVKEISHLLLDQARIIEGEAIPDRASFANRLSDSIEKSIS
jgi:molecular chaperone HtpG